MENNIHQIMATHLRTCQIKGQELAFLRNFLNLHLQGQLHRRQSLELVGIMVNEVSTL